MEFNTINDKINASIFTLEGVSDDLPSGKILEQITHALTQGHPQIYYLPPNQKSQLSMLNEIQKNPNQTIIRYRTLLIDVRVKKGFPVIVEVSGGNYLVDSTSNEQIKMHDPIHAGSSGWMRNTTAISLKEHIHVINSFYSSMLACGWRIKRAEIKVRKLKSPLIESAYGEHDILHKKIIDMVRRPLISLNNETVFFIVTQDNHASKIALEKTKLGVRNLFSESHPPKIVCTKVPSSEGVNLVVVDEKNEFDNMPKFRNILRKAEAKGYKFRIAKLKSIKEHFALNSILVDMSLMSGLVPWRYSNKYVPFCALDAGHHRKQKKSRWVKIENDASGNLLKPTVIDTDYLAEHIPKELINNLWPENNNVVLCRDGKFASEKDQVLNKAKENNITSFECKKNTNCILWHENNGNISPSKMTDAVIDAQGGMLLQTINNNQGDYKKPLRLNSPEDNLDYLGNILIEQRTCAGLSLFTESKLPGTLYYADLISKLTDVGWTKAIGRGLNLENIIPKS